MRIRMNGNRKPGDTVFTQVRALLREEKPYSRLIIFDEYMEITRVDLPRDPRG